MAGVAILSRTQEARTEAAKQRIRSAALILFANNGYAATTLSAISLKAGFSRTLAQYHYSDKADLALELLDERIKRDNHIDMLDCPAELGAEGAWDRLVGHLEAVSDYYGNLHGSSHHKIIVRGEMALHAAALMGSDAALSTRVHDLTIDLISRIERLFETCRLAGLIPADSDSHALAVLHVHSIWGLALALFANPRGSKPIAKAFGQIRTLLDALKVSERY